MTRALIILLVVIVLPGFARGTDNSAPSHEQIKKWWKAEYPKKPNEEIEIHKVKPIRLKSGEKAYLATVRFPRRGHCCWSKALLIRPELNKAKELDEVFQDFEVHDLDNDEISEISTGYAHGMHGQTGREKTIIYFDGWEPTVLHSRGFGDNEGECGSESGHACYMSEVEWTFRELDDDNTLDLIEVISYSEHDEPYQRNLSTKINTYLFKDKKFIPTALDQNQSHRFQIHELERFFCSYPVNAQDHLIQGVNKIKSVLKGEVLYSSARCLGLRISNDNNAKIIGMRLKPTVFGLGLELRVGNKVDVKYSFKNGYLNVDEYKMIKKAPWKPKPKPTKKDCSKHIQLLTQADDEKDMRAKAREYIFCLIQSGLPLEKAHTHVLATVETLNALQKTSITPEKLHLLGPVLSGRMDQQDEVGEAGYPSEANKMKEVSKQEEVQTLPNGQVEAEKRPLTIPAVVADISEIKISKENLRKGTLIQLDNFSDYDLMVSVKFPTESLVYTAIVRKKEQTKVPHSKWNRIPLKFHDSVLLVIIADTDQHRLRKLNGKKIDVSVWREEEHMQSFSIPFRVSKDLLDSAK